MTASEAPTETHRSLVASQAMRNASGATAESKSPRHPPSAVDRRRRTSSSTVCGPPGAVDGVDPGGVRHYASAFSAHTSS